MSVLPTITHIPKCRLCGEDELQPVISFGEMPLSNAFLNNPKDPEEFFPLGVVFCPYCSLVQLAETVSPDKLFREYNYFSSVSAGMLAHAKELADECMGKYLGAGGQVIEIASNDGYLLQYFKQNGIKVLGVDPAENVAKIAEAKGVPTCVDFFGYEMSKALPKADVVLALNVLGHVSDVTGFVDGIREVLKPGGTAIVEVPYVRNMIDSLAFDTIYFEHLYFYSLTALVNLFKWHGLQVAWVEKIPIHCGSLRVYVTHPHPLAPADRYGIDDLLYLEDKLGVNRLEYYRDFGLRVREALGIIRGVLVEKRQQGKRIVGFGAAAKGVMLLNHLKAGINLLDCVVDETPAKTGKYFPGTHNRVVSPTEMGEVDVAFLLAWNWISEFKAKFPEMSGRWLIPFPKLRFE